MTTAPRDLGSIPANEIEPNTEESDFWVLNIPGTDHHIMVQHDGEWEILAFRSEADALEFKVTHSIPDNMVPRFIPKVLQ